MNESYLFRYVCKNKHTGRIYYKVYTIKQLEERSLQNLFDIDNYDIISRDLFTGRVDNNGIRIFEGDKVRWTLGKHFWEAIIQRVPNSNSNILYAIETIHNCTTNEQDEYTFEVSDSRKGCRNDIEYLFQSVEVIGDIHLIFDSTLEYWKHTSDD